MAYWCQIIYAFIRTFNYSQIGFINLRNWKKSSCIQYISIQLNSTTHYIIYVIIAYTRLSVCLCHVSHTPPIPMVVSTSFLAQMSSIRPGLYIFFGDHISKVMVTRELRVFFFLCSNVIICTVSKIKLLNLQVLIEYCWFCLGQNIYLVPIYSFVILYKTWSIRML